MGALAVIAAYLIGGIPFGFIIVKLTTGADVREAGSGNIGATNVLRTTGLVAGVLTLVLDAAKAWIAVWLADRLSGGSELWMSFAALAALLGHAFPVWIRFRGGKAVASFVGAYAYLAPVPLLAVVLLFIFVVAWTRYLSLGSVIAAGLFPVACWMILHPAWPVLLSALGAAVLIVDRHRGNIARIRAGDERIFSFHPAGKSTGMVAPQARRGND
jgi:glycerol-3-phosphate acyltransferase PlsY